jgi:hypothetical protein
LTTSVLTLFFTSARGRSVGGTISVQPTIAVPRAIATGAVTWPAGSAGTALEKAGDGPRLESRSSPE